tara:strand:+ start:3326 stop:3895 length:570 start_codon:yes stop_codon:yes gene_type:complete
MWALVESGSISEVYNKPKQLKIGDIQYPSNIHSLWSATELKAIGVYEVVQDDTNYKNPEYYTNTDQTFTFASNQVKATYGTATAKPLNDTTTDGVVTRGLKYEHCFVIDNQAYSLLEPNDWMVVRNAESSKAIPSDWLDYRVAVRTAASDMKTKINAVSDVDALAALYVYNNANPPVRPLGEFPTPPSS